MWCDDKVMALSTFHRYRDRSRRQRWKGNGEPGVSVAHTEHVGAVDARSGPAVCKGTGLAQDVPLPPSTRSRAALLCPAQEGPSWARGQRCEPDADRGKLEKLTARQPRLRGRPAPMTSHLLACLGDVPPGHTASTRGTESGRSHGDGENCDAPCGA